MMFLNRTFFLILFLGLLLNACKVMSPKAYQRMLDVQDSLNQGWKTAQIKNDHLGDELAKLKADTATLARQLASLEHNLSSRSSEVKKLSTNLAEREQRLKEVEEVLRKREERGSLLKEKLQRALLGFSESGLTVNMREGKVYVLLMDKLLFPSGSIVIDERGKLALTELAKVLNTQPEIDISVEGHTDDQKVRSLGQIKDNWDLSVLRSTSVVRFLTQEQGVEAKRLTATGKGEYTPVDTASTPEAMSLNRRIEIVLSPKLDELYELIK